MENGVATQTLSEPPFGQAIFRTGENNKILTRNPSRPLEYNS
jgi:hypothetical protein